MQGMEKASKEVWQNYPSPSMKNFSWQKFGTALLTAYLQGLATVLQNTQPNQMPCVSQLKSSFAQEFSTVELG